MHDDDGDVPEDGLKAVVRHMENMGWKRHGVTMVKGEHRVTLTFNGVMEISGPEPAPPELLGMVTKGTRQ